MHSVCVTSKRTGVCFLRTKNRHTQSVAVKRIRIFTPAVP